MSIFLEGWQRRDEDRYIEYRYRPEDRQRTRFDVIADSERISIGVCHETITLSVKELEILMSVLDRALQQHLHLREHRKGPPLDEEEEWRRVP